MITKFHTPKSTLLMMVSAFCGHDLMKRAYEEAIKEEYKFYSTVMRCYHSKKIPKKFTNLVSNGEIFFKANVHFKFIVKKK
jgi:hypothetical protein